MACDPPPCRVEDQTGLAVASPLYVKVEKTCPSLSEHDKPLGSRIRSVDGVLKGGSEAQDRTVSEVIEPELDKVDQRLAGQVSAVR